MEAHVSFLTDTVTTTGYDSITTMLTLTSLPLPCLVSLALAGQVDPRNQAQALAPGHVLDTLISGVDCWKVLDLVNASSGGQNSIEVDGDPNGISFTYNSCRGKLSINLGGGGHVVGVELAQLMTQISSWFYGMGNIDGGLWESIRINQFINLGFDVEFELVKDPKISVADLGSTAGSIDPNDTCFNLTSFPALVQNDCHTAFNEWSSWMKTAYPDPNNMTWNAGWYAFIISGEWACQFVTYNNALDPVALNLTSITDEVQKHIFDPCISNGWYGGWSKDHTGLALDFDTQGLMTWFIPLELLSAVMWTASIWTVKLDIPNGIQPQIPTITQLGGKWNTSLLTYGSPIHA